MHRPGQKREIVFTNFFLPLYFVDAYVTYRYLQYDYNGCFCKRDSGDYSMGCARVYYTTLDTVHAVVNLTALPCFTENFDCSLELTQTPSVLTATYHT